MNGGHFDYQLAQKILKERGKEVKPEIATLLKTRRLKNLAEPNPVHKYWIYGGYIFSILGSLFGIMIGTTLIYNKKTLPDGRRVYAYDEKNRDHGTRMILISVVSLMCWLIIRWEILSNS